MITIIGWVVLDALALVGAHTTFKEVIRRYDLWRVDRALRTPRK